MIGKKAGSSTPDQWPASLDALAAASEHHKVLLENDQVRVLDTRIGPGERTPVHTHSWPSVYYVLGCSRTMGARPEKGTALWAAPLGPHSAENVGNGELRVIAVELKSLRTASPLGNGLSVG